MSKSDNSSKYVLEALPFDLFLAFLILFLPSWARVSIEAGSPQATGNHVVVVIALVIHVIWRGVTFMRNDSAMWAPIFGTNPIATTLGEWAYTGVFAAALMNLSQLAIGSILITLIARSASYFSIQVALVRVPLLILIASTSLIGWQLSQAITNLERNAGLVETEQVLDGLTILRFLLIAHGVFAMVIVASSWRHKSAPLLWPLNEFGESRFEKLAGLLGIGCLWLGALAPADFDQPSTLGQVPNLLIVGSFGCLFLIGRKAWMSASSPSSMGSES